MPPPLFPANFSSSSCYNLPKGGGAYPGRDLSRCSSAGQLSHDSAVSAGGGPAVRREHVGRAGRRRGAGRGGSLPHPAGPCPAVSGIGRVSAGLRGRHRPAWLWVSGRAVLSAASGMVRSPSFCTDGSRAPARRTGQQFQHLPSPLAGAAAGLCRRRVSGCAGHPAVSGPERRETFPVTLQIGSASLPLRAFCDTGFSVQEPLSGREVVLVRFVAVQNTLPGPLRSYLSAYFAAPSTLPPPELGLRFVPCTTVSGHCILPAVPAILASAPAQPLYAAFCDLPPPPGGWELLLSPAVVPDAAFR